MIPWIITAAATLLAEQQKKAQQSEDLYAQTVRNSVKQRGGDTSSADVIDAVRQIRSQSADYGPQLLSMVGREFGGGDNRRASGSSAAPPNSSGVRMAMADFFDEDEDDPRTRPRSGVRLSKSDFY